MARYKYDSAPRPSTKMPRGIPYIVGNEFAERFSFYGMKGILVVFMTQYLMTRGGDMDLMSNEQATGYYHLFTSAVYFTPLLGALLADLLFGKYLTIIALSLVYCAGHVTLALDDTRFGLALGLGLIALGAGGIKPCVSAHVGDQFGSQNKFMLPKVFGWFYIAINIGAFLSNLLTPWLLNDPRFGPSWAFRLPGGLMLLATWVFWLGRRKFVHIPPGGAEFVKETFSKQGLSAIAKLSVLYLFVAVFWALFDQTGSTWVIQARSMDRNILGFTLFEAQFQAANPLLILFLVPIFSYLLYPLISKVFPLTPMRKISIGMFITVLAFSVPALIESNITGGRIVYASSQAARRTTLGDWSAWNLIDGEPDGTGWASTVLPKHESLDETADDPEEAAEPDEQDGIASVIIRLRERRSWDISSDQINPSVIGVMNANVPSGDDTSSFSDQTRWVKEVSVLVGSSSLGPWEQVGQATLQQIDSFQSIDFSPVNAAYVKLRVDSNWGGPHVAMGRIKVIAADAAPPSDAAPTATAAWPDVAAVGYKPHISWQLLAYILITMAEVMISITCLEFSYTQAPRRMKSFIMSFYMLSVSVGNLIVAAVNFFIQNEDGTSKLEGPAYYWFFSALMLVTALVFIIVAKFFKEKTYIQEDMAVSDADHMESTAEGVDER